MLVLLWVQSYWWLDMLQVPAGNGNKATLFSCQGAQRLSMVRAIDPRVKLSSEPTSLAVLATPDNAFGFEAKRFGSGFSITTPYWFWTTFVAAVGAVPWLRWRFSLRTLIITTTFVAGVLGLIVWSAR
jgi:hypothetical protein